ncbi:MAG: hypothetical protein ACXW2W_05450 [Telluria sp.]
MPFDDCKLCKQPSQLEKSHIIPASMHKILKNEGKNIAFSLPGKLKMKNQADLQEYLLCKTCEQKFSKFEQSVSILKPLWRRTNEGRNRHTIPAESTTAILKLVHSIFWRASVSSIITNFKFSALEEEELRIALNSDVVVELPRFPVRLDFFTYLRSIGSQQMMQSPFMHKFFPGVTYSAFVSFGIIFSMQAPVQNEVIDMEPYLIAGKEYTISAAPESIESWCIDVLDEVQQIAQNSKKRY